MTLYTAQQAGDETIPPLDIRATIPVPAYGQREHADVFMLAQAEEIVRRLSASLPQGVLDRVTVLLMRRVASDLEVR